MKLLCRLLIIGIACLTCAAQADVPQDGDIQAFAQMLSKRILILDRDLTTFHYETPAEWQPSNLMEIQKRIGTWADRFYDLEYHPVEAQGPGTYVAIDPNASREIGGNLNPQLYVLPIRKGAILLDVRSEMTVDEITLTKAMWAKYNCNHELLSLFIDSFSIVTNGFRGNDTLECRQLLVSAMKQLDIQGILYQYDASNSLAGCRTRNEAINVISSAAWKREKFALFTNHLKIASAKLSHFVARLFNEGRNDVTLRLYSKPENNTQLYTLKNTDVPDREYAAWKEKNIFKCGPNWAGEKTSQKLTQFQRQITTTFSDPEVGDLNVAVHEAYQKKMSGDPSFQQYFAQKLPKIQKLQFKLSGLPQDQVNFEKWKFALNSRDDFNISSAQQNNEAARRLEDPNQFPARRITAEDYDSAIQDLPVLKTKQPALLSLALRKMGFSERFTPMLTSQIIFKMGGIPFLVDRIPTDPANPETELMARNREAFLAILKECLAIYTDPALDYNAVSTGVCGMSGGQ